MPQAWFAHFYAIGTACCLLLLLLATPAETEQQNGLSTSSAFSTNAEVRSDCDQSLVITGIQIHRCSI